jgi:hypothetical protein
MLKILRLRQLTLELKISVCGDVLKNLVSQSQLGPGGRQRGDFARTTGLRLFKKSSKGQMHMSVCFRKTHLEQRSVGESRIGDTL